MSSSPADWRLVLSILTTSLSRPAVGHGSPRQTLSPWPVQSLKGQLAPASLSDSHHKAADVRGFGFDLRTLGFVHFINPSK